MICLDTRCFLTKTHSLTNTNSAEVFLTKISAELFYWAKPKPINNANRNTFQAAVFVLSSLA